MKIKNYTEFRSNLSKIFDEVVSESSPVIVTSGKRQPVVVISLEEYNAYKETFHLTKDKSNYQKLSNSVKNVDNDDFCPRPLKEYSN